MRTYLNLVSGFLPEGGDVERNISGYMDPTVGKAKTAFAGKGNRGKWGIERSICLKVWRCFFVLICFNTSLLPPFAFVTE